ncbi:MAG: transglutaminase domain-containing protein [Oscillospiraceae bacterium]|nr:transglutaminase domain-containing protein [Oscillospiraceae bacterium]
MSKTRTKLFAAILLIICIGACLWGCVKTPEFAVRFYVGDTLHSQQTVTAGECPTPVTVEVAGTVFRGWQNASGEIVDVTAAPVTQDTDYRAVLHPVLDQHAPYLFTDEAGLARPGDSLTWNELISALNALASETAKQQFPTLPTGSDPITYNEIRKTLSSFFPADELNPAFPIGGTAKLSRQEFAVGMNKLLKRNAEQVVLPTDAKLPGDLFGEQTGTYDMLEAIVPHKTGAEGIVWQDVELPELQPGFLNIGGWLYYLQEDGQFLRNGDVDTLHFGHNGRYTCGDTELDALVADILSKLIAENPDMDKLQLLRQCQIYCRDTFEYLRRNSYEFGITGWEIKDAKDIIKTGRGNCYGFAAAFWALARGLGYEAYAISGTCLSDNQPHSWVMIPFDGEEFFFDPEWEWAYHDRKIYDKDMFMISMTQAKYWTYKWTPHW